MNERTNRSFVSGRLNRLGGLAMPILVATLGLTSCAASSEEHPINDSSAIAASSDQQVCGSVDDESVATAKQIIAAESGESTHSYLDTERNAQMAAALQLPVLLADESTGVMLESDENNKMIKGANRYFGQLGISVSTLDKTTALPGGNIADAYYNRYDGNTTELSKNLQSLIGQFERLPKKLFEEIGLYEIVLTGKIGEYDDSYIEPIATFGGVMVFEGGVMYISKNNEHIEGVVLHEIGHLLDDIICNGEIHVDDQYSNYNPSNYDPKLWREGEVTPNMKDFVSLYSTSGVAEDRAEVWERLLAGNEMHSRYIAENIHKKFALLLARLEELIPGISLYLQHHDGGRHTDWRALVLHK